MALSTQIGAAMAKAALVALVAKFDAGGSGAGYIQIRTGSAPTHCADANSGTLLGTLPLSSTSFGTPTTAAPSVATAATITNDSSADASGTALHFRVFDSANVCHMQGTCGTSGANMNFDNNVIVAGGVIAITSLTLTMPENGS